MSTMPFLNTQSVLVEATPVVSVAGCAHRFAADRRPTSVAALAGRYVR
jgi:hypothetical protein